MKKMLILIIGSFLLSYGDITEQITTIKQCYSNNIAITNVINQGNSLLQIEILMKSAVEKKPLTQSEKLLESIAIYTFEMIKQENMMLAYLDIYDRFISNDKRVEYETFLSPFISKFCKDIEYNIKRINTVDENNIQSIKIYKGYRILKKYGVPFYTELISNYTTILK